MNRVKAKQIKEFFTDEQKTFLLYKPDASGNREIGGRLFHWEAEKQEFSMLFNSAHNLFSNKIIKYHLAALRQL